LSCFGPLSKIILHVVLHGCGTWSLNPKEEHRLKVFENRVPRRIFGPKGEELIRELKKKYITIPERTPHDNLYCNGQTLI
jgi:hypothetical protein